MTSLGLLFWILFGIALQLAIFLCIAFWHHWRDYSALRASVGAAPVATPPLPAATPATTTAPNKESWSGFRPFKVTRKAAEDAAQSICSFELEPTDGQPLPSFLPGQFLTFRLELPAADGASEQLVRCYSLSDAPRADRYRVSIKRIPAPLPADSGGQAVPPGRASSYFHDHVDVGSTLQVRAPSGHFHIERSDAPVVLIGGGIGITPMLSMLNWCLTAQPGREVWLFYGVRNSRETIMQAHLDALAAAHANFHLRICFSNPLPEDREGRDFQHRGRVDVALLRMELPLKPYHFYVCGPTPLMETLVPALEDWGVPDAHIHFEAFGPSSIKRRKAADAGMPADTAATSAAAVDAAGDIVVTFAKSGKQFAWQPDAGTLLEFAETHGIAVDSGCRAGGCGTCQTTIQAGEIAYRQTPDFDPEPGRCLLCVCAPKTSVTLEA